MSKRGLTLLLLSLLLLDLILVLVLVGGMVYTNMPSPRDMLAERAGVQADTPQELAAEKMALLATEAMSHVSITGEIHVNGGRARLLLENDAQSGCALVLTLLNEAGETLLATDLIDPGYMVEDITFTGGLPAGSYACLARFQFYELATGHDLGHVGRHVLLIVED